MAMKAQASFMTGNALKLILVMIAAIGFMAFITVGSGNISEFLRQVCERYPDLPFCGGIEGIETRDEKIAKNSVSALACAINSVSAKKELSCVQQFKAGLSSTIYPELDAEKSASVQCSSHSSTASESPTIQYEEGGGWWIIGGWDNICYKYNDASMWMWKLCKDDGFQSVSVDLPSDIVVAGKHLQNALREANTKGNKSYEEGLNAFAHVLNQKSIEYGGEEDKTSDDEIRIIFINGEKTGWRGGGDDDMYVDMGQVGTDSIGPAGSKRVNIAEFMDFKPEMVIDVEICTVKGFYLPQEVSNAEKYIAGFGDPKFLVYWQNFPAGEDIAWTSYSTWMENVGTVVLIALPAGKILKGGKYLIKGAGKTVASSTTTALTSAGSKLVEKLSGKVAGKKGVQLLLFDVSVSRAARIAAIGKAAGQGLFKELIWGAERHYGVGLKSLLAIAGVATVASWAGAHMDSVNDKYIMMGESLVLDIPYSEPEKFSVSELTKSPEKRFFGFYSPMGIIQPVILQREGLFENPTTFYAASPCHADLVVEGGDYIYCREYIFNSDDKKVVCDVTDKEDVMCLGDKSCRNLGPAYLGKKRQEKDIPRCGEISISLEALENNLFSLDNNDDLIADEIIVSHLAGVETLKIIDSNHDGRFDHYEIKHGDITIVSGGTYGGKIDFESDGTFDATFYVDDSQGATVLEVRKNGEQDPFCTHTREGTGYLEKAVFYVDREGTTITQLQFPRIDMEDETCFLKNPLTPPISIKSSGLDFDTLESKSFIVKDTDNDGYWDSYDDNLDGYPEFILDREFSSVRTQYCKVSGLKVSVENKGSYEDKQNFCYSKPNTDLRIGIIVGTIIADVIIEHLSLGFLTQVAVGMTGGALYVASQQYEKWP